MFIYKCKHLLLIHSCRGGTKQVWILFIPPLDFRVWDDHFKIIINYIYF